MLARADRRCARTAPNSDGWFTTSTHVRLRTSRSVRDGRFDRRRWRDAVEDALAAVALDDLSFCRTCWNTCGRSRTWQTEQRPSRVAMRSRRPCAPGRPARRARPAAAASTRRARRARRWPPSSAASTVASSSVSAFFSASISFCCAASACSAFLTSAVELVGLHHPLEHLFFDGAEIALRGFDLVLHRLVFAVGLDGGELVFELRRRPW